MDTEILNDSNGHSRSNSIVGLKNFVREVTKQGFALSKQDSAFLLMNKDGCRYYYFSVIFEANLLTLETIGHQIKSLESKFLQIKKVHENKFRIMNNEIMQLVGTVNKQVNDFKESRVRREKLMREFELRMTKDIVELRDTRNSYDFVIKEKINNHISRMTNVELSRSADVDSIREKQFLTISNSLNELTNMVDELRKKRKGIQSNFEEIMKKDSKEVLVSINNESERRNNSVDGIKGLLNETLNHFYGELGLSKENRTEVDKQILDQLELACNDVENKLIDFVGSERTS
ncbi:hypothetical protein FG379_002743 [Cryptosporidium bovis]|uniref:uncharacterized protein n=1 Tax=Cryptosporidium bovis TaxID=310047 RepID=UPI00351A6500|nr:hypothetical protein FG379_002743 [Cryptosporidium bovis]